MSKIRYLLDGKLAVASVLQSDLESSGALPDETEGFIDFVMGIKGVEVGVCIMQIGGDKYKCSLRSKTVDVNAVASRFGGGGHILASGCQIQGEYEEVVDDIRYAVKQQIPE
jgi:phosphoesterase RecJ-like protein